MTIGDDRPDLSDFPRIIPPHQCWRNGGVECRACELEEQAGEAGVCLSCGHQEHEFACGPDAGLSTVGTLLLCLIFLPLLALALLKGGQAGVCWMNGDALAYCDGYTAVQR